MSYCGVAYVRPIHSASSTLLHSIGPPPSGVAPEKRGLAFRFFWRYLLQFGVARERGCPRLSPGSPRAILETLRTRQAAFIWGLRETSGIFISGLQYWRPLPGRCRVGLGPLQAVRRALATRPGCVIALPPSERPAPPQTFGLPNLNSLVIRNSRFGEGDCRKLALLLPGVVVTFPRTSNFG